ncbi:SDR family NAD(P)-dependent oxidoreductase [Thermodesulfobacteriota bacterium]
MTKIGLKNRVVIVTGGSQGLGRSMALALAEAGARLVLVSPDKDKLSQVAGEIVHLAGQGQVLKVIADITNLDDCKKVVGQSLDTFGAVEVLVNNARNITRGHPKVPFWESDPGFWQKSIHVNVNGTFLMSYTVTPYFIAQGWGRIVNISTSLGTIQRKGAPYGVSKAAIEAETIIWAKDLKSTGVTVNSLLPGGRVYSYEGKISEDGRELLPVDIMNPLIIWLASNLSDGKTGGRYVGKNWDPTLPPNDAAEKAREAPVFLPPPPDEQKIEGIAKTLKPEREEKIP